MGLVTKGGNANVPIEYLRWQLVEKFGWTLEYVDALEMQDFHEYLQVQDGIAKAKGSLLNKGR